MSQTKTTLPSFATALRFWVKLGFLSFGGPAGQIAMMHRELVEERRWIDHRRFMDGLNFCMLLPGPEAMQLATYLGWRMHGTKGGIAAGAMFVIPSALILFALAWLAMTGAGLAWLDAMFLGLMAAVIAIVGQAIWRIGKRALTTPALWCIACAAFLAIFAVNLSFVWIILTAGLLGAFGNRFFPAMFPQGGGHGDDHAGATAAGESLDAIPAASWRGASKVTLTCLLLWAAPLAAVALLLGWQSVPAQQGVFFSKAAMVTFGGAYAVLPYVAQQAVESHGWLSHPQMMTGLALAESTPGPLIMVLQFVGFVGAWQNPGDLTPLAAASVGASITTWVTFLPCFWFIFLGGPYVERLGDMPRVSAALTSLTAAVVGLILNLAVKFTHHAIWPDPETMRWQIALLAVVTFIALTRFRIGLIPVIATCAVLGAAGLLG
jgi:chromate transporter